LHVNVRMFREYELRRLIDRDLPAAGCVLA
jgi:hypothetical protein